MPEMNRRNFLIASVGAAGLLSGAAVTLPQLLHHGQQRPLSTDAGILVILTLYGTTRAAIWRSHRMRSWTSAAGSG